MTTTAVRATAQDLDDLASAVSAYCRARLPEPTLARPGQVRDGGAVRVLWMDMVAELGIDALLIAEEHGGAGASLAEVGRVAETLAAELAPVPFLAAGVLAPALLTSAGTPAAEALLRAIAQDGRVVVVALAGDPVTRHFSHVMDADLADVVVLAGADKLVAVDAADLAITARASFDLTRGLCDVVADGAPGTVLATGDAARSAYDAMLVAGRLALAADSAGGAQAALRHAVAYARERVQFGREIGSFQALKHLLADRHVDAESALSVARVAIEAHVTGAPDARVLQLLAAFYCAEKFADVAADDIQVHGGMGFTAECRAHLYRRRAESNRQLLGEPAALRAAYVDALCDQEGAA